MTNLARDIQFGVRQLRRSPAFTVVALLALALGVGANTAIFSVVHATLLAPMPFPEPRPAGHGLVADSGQPQRRRPPATSWSGSGSRRSFEDRCVDGRAA